MADVLRLKTFVDTRDVADQSRQMSVKTRLEAVLADGRRVVLLDDRGWSGKRNDGGDPWEFETVEDLQREARNVVGPDEADTDADHWNALAHTLRREGIDVTGAELAALPHEVVLSDRVMARIGGHGS